MPFWKQYFVDAEVDKCLLKTSQDFCATTDSHWSSLCGYEDVEMNIGLFAEYCRKRASYMFPMQSHLAANHVLIVY